MTHFVTGSIRIAVELLVMAAEIDVSMRVCVFEEMTQTKTLPNVIFSVKMRSNLHILTSHPLKTKHY